MGDDRKNCTSKKNSDFRFVRSILSHYVILHENPSHASDMFLTPPYTDIVDRNKATRKYRVRSRIPELQRNAEYEENLLAFWVYRRNTIKPLKTACQIRTPVR